MLYLPWLLLQRTFSLLSQLMMLCVDKHWNGDLLSEYDVRKVFSHIIPEIYKNKVRVMVCSIWCVARHSTISWRSFLFVEETGVPGENHRPAASHWQIISQTAISIKRPCHEWHTNSQH